MPRQIIHEGRKIKVVLDTSTGPNGETIRRDMILHPGAVVILPVISSCRNATGQERTQQTTPLTEQPEQMWAAHAGRLVNSGLGLGPKGNHAAG